MASIDYMYYSLHSQFCRYVLLLGIPSKSNRSICEVIVEISHQRQLFDGEAREQPLGLES